MGTCPCPCCEGTGLRLQTCPNRPSEGWVNLIENNLGNGWEKLEQINGKFRCPYGSNCDLITDAHHSQQFFHQAPLMKHESLPAKGAPLGVQGPGLMRAAMAQAGGASSNEADNQCIESKDAVRR